MNGKNSGNDRASREYSTEWGHLHSPGYEGVVWFKIIPIPKNKGIKHEFLLTWGIWQFRGDTIPYNTEGNCFHHIMIDDGLVSPLALKVSLPCHVIFGNGAPPDENSHELIYGWGLAKPLTAGIYWAHNIFWTLYILGRYFLRKPQKKNTVRCSTCNGSGRIEIPNGNDMDKK
jgi:hypothetical protein